MSDANFGYEMPDGSISDIGFFEKEFGLDSPRAQELNKKTMEEIEQRVEISKELSRKGSYSLNGVVIYKASNAKSSYWVRGVQFKDLSDAVWNAKNAVD